MQSVCDEPDCDKPHVAKGKCSHHYYIERRGPRNQKSPTQREPWKRKRAPKGAGYTAPNGYRYITVGGKRVLEHRHVMEQKLGRKLLPGETVHHKGSPSDNRPHKLELRVKAHGQGWTVTEAIAWANEILARYT